MRASMRVGNVDPGDDYYGLGQMTCIRCPVCVHLGPVTYIHGMHQTKGQIRGSKTRLLDRAHACQHIVSFCFLSIHVSLG